MYIHNIENMYAYIMEHVTWPQLGGLEGSAVCTADYCLLDSSKNICRCFNPCHYQNHNRSSKTVQEVTPGHIYISGSNSNTHLLV